MHIYAPRRIVGRFRSFMGSVGIFRSFMGSVGIFYSVLAVVRGDKSNFIIEKAASAVANAALIFVCCPFRPKVSNYSMISVTTPDPTVLPPSRIANLSPVSIAIGVIRLISMTMLSPGIHISTPSGSFRSPVTSVVRK